MIDAKTTKSWAMKSVFVLATHKNLAQKQTTSIEPGKFKLSSAEIDPDHFSFD